MYQSTTIVGRLGNDPEMRYTPSGVPVASFNVAVNKRWTDQSGQQQERTTWFRVTAWRKLGENCAQYLHKGSLVFVEGDVEASAWTGQDGQPRASLELTARTVKFLDNKGSNSKSTEEEF